MPGALYARRPISDGENILMTSRRRFIEVIPAAAAALLAGGRVFAQAPNVDEKDPVAVSLGYVADATKTKAPTHVAGAMCGNCSLYQGKAGDAAGMCPLFAGKQVTSKGWCTAYAKKA